MRSRSWLVVPLIAVATLSLAGCSTGDSDILSKQTEARFDTYSDFSANANAKYTSASWVPTDSTSLATMTLSQKPGYTMKFVSKTGVTSKECAAAPLKGKPKVESAWSPDVVPTTGLACGDWQLFSDPAKGYWFAWIN